MLTLRSPYLNVQAIRRKLQDQGIRTEAIPFIYTIPISLPDVNAGTMRSNTVQVDADSDFVWVSTYWYTQGNALSAPKAPSGPAVGAAEDNQPQNKWHAFEMRMQLTASRRRLHKPEFIGPLMFDYFQGLKADAGGPHIEFRSLMNDVSLLQNPDDTSISIWRHHFQEPIRIGPTAGVEIAVRVGPDGSFNTVYLGHLFLLLGVRLYRR